MPSTKTNISWCTSKWQALTDTAQREVIRHRFAGRKAYEFGQRQGVVTTPADAVLRIEGLELFSSPVKNMRKHFVLGKLIIRKPHAALLFLAPANTHTVSSAKLDSLFTPIPVWRFFQRAVMGRQGWFRVAEHTWQAGRRKRCREALPTKAGCRGAAIQAVQ